MNCKTTFLVLSACFVLSIILLTICSQFKANSILNSSPSTQWWKSVWQLSRQPLLMHAHSFLAFLGDMCPRVIIASHAAFKIKCDNVYTLLAQSAPFISLLTFVLLSYVQNCFDQITTGIIIILPIGKAGRYVLDGQWKPKCLQCSRPGWQVDTSVVPLNSKCQLLFELLPNKQFSCCYTV